MRRIVLFAVLSVGCGDEGALGPERSVRIALQSTGLPGDTSARYRIFLRDTVAIAHGEVATGETDTVRVGSTDPLRVQWQDARVAFAEVEYVYGPARRDTIIDGVGADTTVSLRGSYALASGGFALTTPGIPANLAWDPEWWVVTDDDSVLARGVLGLAEVVRRGDLPLSFAPGDAIRPVVGSILRLDSAFIDLEGVLYAYAPSPLSVPLTVTASLDLAEIDAPYDLVSTAVRLSASGLPAGTSVSCFLTATSGRHGIIAWVEAESPLLAGLVTPDSYIISCNEVTVDGVTYLPHPVSQMATLEARIEPHEFNVAYTAAP